MAISVLNTELPAFDSSHLGFVRVKGLELRGLELRGLSGRVDLVFWFR